MPALRLHAASRSLAGRREGNEDRCYASPRLAVVADGVGGAAAGEVASGLVVHAFQALDKRWLEGELDVALAGAARDADGAVHLAGEARPAWRGLGSTLTAVAVDDAGGYVVAQVGDSRAYLPREGGLRRLTRDESLVQVLLDDGRITEREARAHPRRNVVLRALDGRGDHLPQLGRLDARAGDRLLLCSDGVSDVLDDAALGALLARGAPAAAAAALVDAALLAGSRDNVTAVVADVRPDAGAVGWWRPAAAAA